jgi:hypothetical protein
MPETFLDEIEYLYDPSETGNVGCLLPKLDDPPEDTDGPDE